MKMKREPKPQKLNEDGEEFISREIENNVSISLKQLKAIFRTEKNIVVSNTTIANKIKKLRFTLKRLVNIPVARNTDSA
ncbi:hypothetical protein GVAV_002098 [Gurleya vavrai]